MKGLQGKMRGQEQGMMGAPEEQELEEATPDSERDELPPEENLDVQIGTSIVNKMLQNPEAQSVIQEALNGQGDPAAQLGLFLSQMIDKIQTKMDKTPTPLSPRIWLSQGGVIDNVIAEISPELVDPVKDEVMNLLKLQSKTVGGGKGAPMEGEMPPEAGMPPMGGGQPPLPMGGGQPPAGGGQPPMPMMGGM